MNNLLALPFDFPQLQAQPSLWGGGGSVLKQSDNGHDKFEFVMVSTFMNEHKKLNKYKMTVENNRKLG